MVSLTKKVSITPHCYMTHESNSNRNLIQQDGELYLHADFISPNIAKQYTQSLIEETPWQQRSITIFGKTVDQPRLVSWHAEKGIPYKYSGITMLPKPWPKTLLTIKHAVENKLGEKFNSAFLNLYRNGQDYMGWHRDNEKLLGPEPYIASLSFGAQRKFKFKHISNTQLNYELMLNSGSLLVMGGNIQHHWKHCLPKALKVKQPRVNITFRQVLS